MVKKIALVKKLHRLISKKSPFQEKKINLFHKKLTKDNFIEIEEYLELYRKFLLKNRLSLDNAVSSYVEMCNDMFNCHIKFLRSGKYPVLSLDEAKKNVYFNPKKMRSYMVGLAISQFFWETHFKMFKHLQKMILSKLNTKYYLEIGPGHGLFSFFSIKTLKNLSDYTAVDISKTSLELTKEFIKLNTSRNLKKKLNFINKDFLDLNKNKKYELIVCGEVLEHVLNPTKLLKKIQSILKEEGKVFVSTCINCPAIDHVNQFFNIEDIEKMFLKAKFNVVSRKILPVENVSYKTALKKKITVNYSAILEKK